MKCTVTPTYSLVIQDFMERLSMYDIGTNKHYTIQYFSAGIIQFYIAPSFTPFNSRRPACATARAAGAVQIKNADSARNACSALCKSFKVPIVDGDTEQEFMYGIGTNKHCITTYIKIIVNRHRQLQLDAASPTSGEYSGLSSWTGIPRSNRPTTGQ